MDDLLDRRRGYGQEGWIKRKKVGWERPGKDFEREQLWGRGCSAKSPIESPGKEKKRKEREGQKRVEIRTSRKGKKLGRKGKRSLGRGRPLFPKKEKCWKTYTTKV